MDLKKVKKIKWHKIGSWDTPFFSDYLLIESIQKAKQSGFQRDFNAVLYLYGEAYIGQTDFDYYYDFYKKSYTRNGLTDFMRLRKTVLLARDKALSFSGQIKKRRSFTKDSNEKLLGFFMKFISTQRANIIAGFIFPVIETLVKEIIDKELYFLEKLSLEKSNEFLTTLASPLRTTAIAEENENLLKIAVDISKNKELAGMLKSGKIKFVKTLIYDKYPLIKSKLVSHQDVYGWMSNFNWHDKQFRVDDYLKHIKSMLIEGDVQSKLVGIKFDRAMVDKKYNKFVAEIKYFYGVDAKKLTKFIRDFVSLKMENWEAVAIAGNDCLNLFEEIADRSGIVLKNFFSLSHVEIIDMLIGSDKRPVDLREKRGALGISKKIYILRDKQVLDLKKALNKFIKKDLLKGLVVFPGSVKGRVVKIMTVKEIGKMVKGGILVCPMTNPDYIPAIRKAAAIITDGGGILCHAAIVAREFKIPAIVGTKDATKVLKDGMMVEVDANKGLVRIINK